MEKVIERSPIMLKLTISLPMFSFCRERRNSEKLLGRQGILILIE